MTTRISRLLLLGATLTAMSSFAEEFPLPPLPDPPPGYAEPSANELERMLAPEQSLEWHRDAKFGISVHWGPVALTGAPMSWGRYGPRPGAGRPATSGIPREEYDALFQHFNPVDFDAEEWMSLFARAGARYFYFTAKHHDGFCMFDTATTDYDIMATPFARDVVAELAEAGQAQGLKVLWYYSQPDWVHPDALQEGHYERYLPYMQKQVSELLTKYGKIDGLWFDHLGTRHYHWDSVHWLPELRKEHPGLLFNNRIGHGLEPKYQGDWFVYELRVGPWKEPRQWETNTTLTRAWAWHGGDLVKPYDTVLRLLLQVVGNGGNLLLNVGPTPAGRIAGKEQAVLERLGNWLRDYGSAVYATRKGNFRPGPWGASARTETDLFLYVLEQHAGGDYRFTLPPLERKPVSLALLTPGDLSASLEDDAWHFTIRGKHRLQPAVIRLSFARALDGVPAVVTYPAANKLGIERIVASSRRSEHNAADVLLRHSDEGVFGEGIHIRNWWAPAPDDREPWLEVELAQPSPVASLLISESMRTHAVREFKVSYMTETGDWEVAFSGASIGDMLGVRLDTPRTSRIRLDFLQYEDSPPNITVVELFAP